jgi:hypothetical protein
VHAFDVKLNQLVHLEEEKQQYQPLSACLERTQNQIKRQPQRQHIVDQLHRDQLPVPLGVGAFEPLKKFLIKIQEDVNPEEEKHCDINFLLQPFVVELLDLPVVGNLDGSEKQVQRQEQFADHVDDPCDLPDDPVVEVTL